MSRSWSSRSLHIFLFLSLALASCSSLEAARYRRQAEQFLAEGKLPEAVLTYRQALEKSPDDPGLLAGLGKALAAQGRHRSAQGYLQRADQLTPGDASIQDALGDLQPQPQNGLGLQLAWIASGANTEPVGAAVAAGRVFVAYAGGSLMALDQASGQLLWEVESPAGWVSPPAADSSQVWVGAEDGTIFIYEAASGNPLGTFLTGGAVYAAPALTPEVAYCPSNDGMLYALRRDTFEPLWKAEVGAALHVSPFVGDQAVYVGANNGRLYAFHLSNGERLWQYGILTQGAVESVPVSADGRIYFGSGDGRVYALDAETGGQYWRYSTPDAIYASPLVWNDQLIVASSGQVLASVSRSDGAQAWSLSFDHAVTQAPALFRDRLYLITRGDPRLFAVDPATGKLLGDVNTGDWLSFGPFAVGDGLILIGQDGSVFLYR